MRGLGCFTSFPQQLRRSGFVRHCLQPFCRRKVVCLLLLIILTMTLTLTSQKLLTIDISKHDMSDYLIQTNTIVRTFNPSLTQKRDFKTTLPNSKVDSGNQKSHSRNIHEIKRYGNRTSSNGVHVAEHDTNTKSGQNSGGKLHAVPPILFIDKKPEAYLDNNQALADALINNRNAHGVAKLELKPQSYHTQSPSKSPAYRGNVYPDIDVDEYRQAELGTFRHSGEVFRQPGPSDIDHVEKQARESGAHHFRKGNRDERLPSHHRHHDHGRMKLPGVDPHMRGREQMHRPWELRKKTQAQEDRDKELVSLMGARWRGQRQETHNTKGEQRHVFFLKVHKAASTTVMNVLYRFALQRNLNVALPMQGNILSENSKMWARRLMPPPAGASYFDILCNHLVFHEPSVSVTLPADASFIGIVREPFQQFVSAFEYYRTNFNVKYLKKINSSDPIATYLHDPALYEPARGPSSSYTHNRMSFDFGMDPGKMNSEGHVRDYVSHLNRTFQLVMVSERFDESMVLLKRLLGWRLQDVLYIKNNVLKGPAGGGGNSQLTAGQRQAHRDFNAADYALYKHFAQLFQAKVEAEGKLFPQEVAAFVTMREKVETFCTGAANASNEGQHLTLAATAWTGVFEVPKKECRLMTLQENRFVDLVRQWQYGPLLMEKYQFMMSRHRRGRLFIPPRGARFNRQGGKGFY